MNRSRTTPNKRKTILPLLQSSPIIASAKDEAGLARALASECQTVFILYGSILTIGDIIGRVKATGRNAFINVDMVDGLSTRPAASKFIHYMTAVDGILSSKAPVVRAAREQGLLTVMRLFMIDSFAYDQMVDQVAASQAHAVEVLPGCIPRVITWIREDINLPIVAGGLVCDEADVHAAFDAGAAAVASSNADVIALAGKTGLTTP
ncbi:MAG: glycerol-3-phosphate responsive antiterminator [Actinomycetaceae bacterium]|nr:glycerol-3-phosphate responsive antiterminator [Actinomycetaceae bacterium]